MAHGLSCSAACGIFPDQGLNQSPALAGGFFTTEPPGKPLNITFYDTLFIGFKVCEVFRILVKLKNLTLGATQLKTIQLKNICGLAERRKLDSPSHHLRAASPVFIQQHLMSTHRAAENGTS